jgi:hypothetical protein
VREDVRHTSLVGEVGERVVDFGETTLERGSLDRAGEEEGGREDGRDHVARGARGKGKLSEVGRKR